MGDTAAYLARIDSETRRDGQVGYWTRQQVVSMDNKALAWMIRCHPEKCPPQLMELLTYRVQPPSKPTVTAQEALDALLGVLDRRVISAMRESAYKLTARQEQINHAQAIKRDVAARYDITTACIDGEARPVKFLKARHEALYLVARDTTLSYARIGRLFGDRDHTTVISGIRTHARKNALPLPRGLTPTPVPNEERYDPRWPPERVAKLVAMRRAREPYSVIAEALGTTVGSLGSKMRRFKTRIEDEASSTQAS